MNCCESEGMTVRFKKWIGAVTAGVLLSTTLMLTPAVQAEQNRTIADESIYDLLVDRFFNGIGANDDDLVNAQDPAMFAGGDFNGLIKKLDYITGMGFTTVSIGSVFATEKYDGSMVTSYSTLEKHFGTEDELKEVVKKYNDRDMKVMVDFPLSNVSPNHEWASKPNFVTSSNDGQIQWDLANIEVQKALIDAAIQFVNTYNVNGMRLTNIENADVAFVNTLIDRLKEANPEMYVISNAESDAHFDAKFYTDTEQLYRGALKNVDLNTTVLDTHIEEFITGKDVPTQVMIDNVWTDRFTLDATEEKMYPPTRNKIAVSTALLLPGVPVVQYGTEIAMNGTAGQEAHQYYNFKTDSELVDYIGQLQTLRNSSETLRNGEFKWLMNEDGYMVFERKSDTETWIVVINNSSKTKRVNIPVAELGEGKEVRGMFNSEIIRANKDDNYTIILDREMVEVYQVIEARGINTSYIVALSLVVIIYTLFMIVIIKRGRKRRAEQAQVN